MNDYEYTFRQDVVDKKRTARGASSRASRRRGLKGAVKMPVDFMKGKERKAYMFGETTTSILTFDEFKALDVEQRKIVLENLRKKYRVSEIAQMWGVAANTVSNHLSRLQLSDKKFATNSSKAKTEGEPFVIRDLWSEPISPPATQAQLQPLIQPQPAVWAMPQPAPVPPVEGFSIGLNGKYSGEVLADKLLKIADLLSRDYMYEINVKVVENDKIIDEEVYYIPEKNAGNDL